MVARLYRGRPSRNWEAVQFDDRFTTLEGYKTLEEWAGQRSISPRTAALRGGGIVVEGVYVGSDWVEAEPRDYIVKTASGDYLVIKEIDFIDFFEINEPKAY